MNDPNNYGPRFNRLLGCVTVDSTDTEPDYLTEVRCSPSGRLIHPVHPDTASAVNNLLRCHSRNISVHFVGHGEPGLIITGSGRANGNPQKMVDTTNGGIWKPLFDDFRDHPISSLYLLSCGTGAESEGLDLLSQIASTVDATVAAPAGDIFCNDGNFELEDGAAWQVVDPTKARPAVIPLPVRPDRPPGTVIAVFIPPSLGRGLPLAAAVTLRISAVTRVSIKNSKGAPIRELNQREIKRFLSLIEFDNPINLPGMPSGILTGTFLLEGKDHGVFVGKEFEIVGKRLVFDKKFKKGYYCKKEIIQFI